MSIVFELSRDPGLLEQYYALRQRCFRQELGIPQFNGSEEEPDRHGRILLASRNGQCLGGARISPRIPFEQQLEELKLDLQLDACCLWERFVLHPAVRTLEFQHAFCTQLIAFSRRAGFDYALVLSSLRNARFYRRCHSALGVGFRIHSQLPDCAQGAFTGLEHYLSVSELQDGLMGALKGESRGKSGPEMRAELQAGPATKLAA